MLKFLNRRATALMPALVVEVLLPTNVKAATPTDGELRARASARWSQIGFMTRMADVNGTRLFVAEGGAA